MDLPEKLSDHCVPSRAKIDALEVAVGAMQQVDLHTTHELAGGVYARTIVIPAGTVLVGCVHKKDHINVFQGDITAWTDEGMKRFTGHHVIPGSAGIKRAGYAHTETVWTTLSHTENNDLADLAAIEDELVENPESLQTRKFLKNEAQPQIGVE